ncbi:MAG: glycosyltransferase, partial [Oscillospiraceae bacterium]|nr:glycosyltransferase [Oscillospiraceae bacterium]
MKVLLLNDSFPPVLDGVANVLLNYAHYLTEDYGAEVMVGTPYYPDADYSSYPYKVVTYQSFDTSSITNGYRAGNPFASKAIAEMAEFKPDIIHVHCPASAAVIARILRETTGAPLIFTYHTKYDIDIRRVVKNKLVANETIKAMVGVVEAANEVWAVSEGAGKSLEELGFEGEWSVMPNGVDFERGRVEPEKVAEATRDYDLGENIPVFLFVGRMMTYKNIPLILDALKMLADSGRDFRAVFIGKGPDKELMEEKAKDLGIADKTIFTGAIYDRDTLRAWNTRADLFLFPSTFDTNGLVVRE